MKVYGLDKCPEKTCNGFAIQGPENWTFLGYNEIQITRGQHDMANKELPLLKKVFIMKAIAVSELTNSTRTLWTSESMHREAQLLYITIDDVLINAWTKK